MVATVVATTLTKLALRTRLHAPPVASNLVAADVILLLTGLLRLGTTASGRPPSGGRWRPTSTWPSARAPG